MSAFELQASSETREERDQRLSAQSDARQRDIGDFHGYDPNYAQARDRGYSSREIERGVHHRRPVVLSDEGF